MTRLAKAAAWVLAMGAMIFGAEMLLVKLLIDNGWTFN